ncbi:MAG: MFS transporter [Haliea sp.]|nr:MFS transporter [Haliea sp.]
MNNRFATVWLLAAINAIAMSSVPMMMLVGSLIGAQLAPAERWATLPIAMMVIGTACGVVPATRTMQRLGRRTTLGIFIAIGIIACAVLGQALAMHSFVLFCAGSCLLGVTAAALQQTRFAAMECVPLADGPVAASIIMCAGIVAAFAGPELAVRGQYLSAVEFQASFWLGAACLLAAGALLCLYTPAHRPATQPSADRRTSLALLGNPTLLLAVVSGASAFMVMSFVMTATPISMHLHHGHSLEDTKWVLQSHIAAMFLPSLFTPWLFRLIKIRGLMLAGLACYCATIVIGLVDASVLGFWGQLVMLGIGWNFLFVSGTALLPMAYQPGEEYRAQALNDTVIFSSQAAASLGAGWAISAVSWQALLLLCLVPMVVLLVLLLWQRVAAQ